MWIKWNKIKRCNNRVYHWWCTTKYGSHNLYINYTSWYIQDNRPVEFHRTKKKIASPRQLPQRLAHWPWSMVYEQKMCSVPFDSLATTSLRSTILLLFFMFCFAVRYRIVMEYAYLYFIILGYYDTVFEVFIFSKILVHTSNSLCIIGRYSDYNIGTYLPYILLYIISIVDNNNVEPAAYLPINSIMIPILSN